MYPRDSQRGFQRGVSGRVSGGFPWVSGGFLNDFTQDLLTINYVFAEFYSSVSVKTGVSNASEWPYYNIRRPQVIGVGERVGAGPVSSVPPLCPLEF